MSLSKKQIRNKSYYEKNKERIIENIKARKLNKLKQTNEEQTNREAETKMTETTTETKMTETMTETKMTETDEPKKVKVVRIPFPALDFLIWTKRMTYVCIDIRDTTGKFVWKGMNRLINKDTNLPASLMEMNGDEEMILSYYKLINTKKDFAIWIRNIRRVNNQFCSIRDSHTKIEE